jgi:sphinganine-1-phosphate aldolase
MPDSKHNQPSLPVEGCAPEDVFAEMEEARADDVRWREGRLGLYVHFGGDDVLQVAKNAYLQFFSENALGPTAFPSLKKFETEVVAWTATLLGASAEARGNITGGGTESIFLAMKSIRDWARDHGRGGQQPQVIAPYSAHPAFDKAAYLLGMTVRRVPLQDNLAADVLAMADAVDELTVGIIGSAPGFPHGIIDPIEDIAQIARRHDLWMHVDGCVGGFILPFARALGHNVPAFDFSVPGVRSMSADLHKYAYAAKGASVVVYADEASYAYQPYAFEDWPRGRYSVPTFAGSRPGGAIAAAWAVMRYLGQAGYERLVAQVLDARDRLANGINAMDDLYILGQPQGPILTYGSTGPDVFAIAEAMRSRGWFVTLADEPPCIHMGMLTLMHVPVVDTYLEHLEQACADVRTGRVGDVNRDAGYGG